MVFVSDRDEIENVQNQFINNRLLIVAMYSFVYGPIMTVMEILSMTRQRQPEK